jgi:SRSO17 transposase
VVTFYETLSLSPVATPTLIFLSCTEGESSQFIQKLTEYQLAYVVAIRSNHGVWLPAKQSVRANKWCKFERYLLTKNQKPDTLGK